MWFHILLSSVILANTDNCFVESFPPGVTRQLPDNLRVNQMEESLCVCATVPSREPQANFTMLKYL